MARKNELARPGVAETAPSWPSPASRERGSAQSAEGDIPDTPNPAKRCSQAVTETGVVSLRPPGRRISSIYKSLSRLLHSLTHASRHSHARHPSASRTRQRCISLLRPRGYPRSGSFPTCVCGAGSVNRHPARQWHGHSRRPHRRHCLPRNQRRVVPLHRTEAADIALLILLALLSNMTRGWLVLMTRSHHLCFFFSRNRRYAASVPQTRSQNVKKPPKFPTLCE